MSNPVADMPLLNQLTVLIVGVAYFVGIGMFSYKRGGSLTLWSFVIGAGALVFLSLFGDRFIDFFNKALGFVLGFLGDSAADTGTADGAQVSSLEIVACTSDNLATCNGTGFLYLSWLGIVITGHIVIECLYRCVLTDKLKSTPTFWAFLVGIVNAWIYGYVLLPPLCLVFGAPSISDPFTSDLLNGIIEFARAVWDLCVAVFGGIWAALGWPCWLAFMLIIIVVLVVAASSTGKGNK